MAKKRKPKSRKRKSRVVVNDETHYLVMLRVIECDDSTIRLEPLEDKMTYKLSEDPSKNKFVTAYMTKAGLSSAGFSIQKNPKAG